MDPYVRVRLADEGGPVVVGVGGRRPPQPEQEVGLTADSQDVLTFRSKTGGRIVCWPR